MLIILLGAMGFSADVRAEVTPDPVVQKANLLDIARKMVDKVGTKLSQAKREQEEKKNPLARVEDGEILIFKVWLNGKLPIEGEIVTEKQGPYLLASFRDFLNTLRFPITLNSDTLAAEGWYINETQLFTLNWETRQVTASGRTFTLSKLARQEGDDLMIPLSEMEAWFSLSMRPEVASLIIDLRSLEKLPLEDRLARRDRKGLNQESQTPSTLPPLEDPYRMIEIPVVDVSTSLSHRRPPRTSKGQSTTTYSQTLQAEGDLLHHTGELYLTGNKENFINNARFNLSKSSQDEDLLGVLGARKYEFGDVVVTDMPLFGNSAQELGARVTNKDSSGRTSFTSKNFTGDLPPGWDVELYQNEQLIGFQTVGDDGLYRFENVQLFAGENDFKFVFYGPQGEYREEDVNIPVNIAELQGTRGIYDFSVSAQETSTYSAIDEDRPEKGDISASGTYEYVFAPGLSGIVGFRQRSFGEEQKTNFLAGFSSALGGGLLTSNLGYDVEGETGLDTSYRIRMGQHDLSSNIYIATDGFTPNGVSENPTVLGTSLNVKGPLFYWDKNRVDYGFSNTYSQDASGEDLLTVRQNLSTLIGRTRLGHELEYRQQSALDEDTIESNFTASGTLIQGLRWRARANYQYAPDSYLDQTFLEVTKNITKGLSVTGEAEYQPENEYKKGTLRANWQTDDQIITPQISLDSEDELRATISTRYGLIRDPRTGDIDRTRIKQTGNGAVSAFVFLDKDGDNKFGTGDEPIEGARVDAVQSRRYAETDDKGVALVQGLNEETKTDIVVNGFTLGDPFLVAGTPGASIVTRPGHIPTLDFPIHQAGEMDGTIWIQREETKRPAKNIRLSLYDSEGKQVASTQTAYDGFYIFSPVPPGSYYMTFESEDLKSLGVSAPAPQKIAFGYEGTFLYGRDFTLTGKRGQGSAGFNIVPDLKDVSLRHPHVDMPDISASTPILNLGSYKSQLMMSLVLYKIQKQYPGILRDVQQLVKPSDSLPDLKTNLYTLRVVGQGMTAEDAYRRCQSLSLRGVSCTVEIVPHGLKHDPARQAALENPAKG
ncbi:MAG: carboxypeptidase regulatory-like domain-containing protein [Alphaproteobacteria bacterium]|nr:carboxypeptidase regulatory-like domain-containing protein [Alphaproteobacteria bacterium]